MDSNLEEFGFSSETAKAYALARLIKLRLEDISIPVNELLFDELVKRIESYMSEGLEEFDIPKGILKEAKRRGHKGTITVDIGGLSDEEFKEFYIQSTAELGERKQRAQSLETYNRNNKLQRSRLRDRRKQMAGFLSSHRILWEETLDLVELFFLICFDLGSEL